MKMTEQRLQAFMVDYIELCKKHQMFVNACGCCNSPWVVDAQGFDLDNQEELIRSTMEYNDMEKHDEHS